MASNEPMKPKKRRLQGACDACRKKKIKCDSAKMPGFRCSNCVAFGSECTHVHVAKKTMFSFGSTGSTPPAPILKGLNLSESKPLMNPLIDAILDPNYQPPTSRVPLRQTISSLAQFARMLDAALTSANERLASYGSPPQSRFAAPSASSSRESMSPASSSEPSQGSPPAESGSATESGTQTAREERESSLVMDDISSLSQNLRQGLILDSYAPRFYGPSSIIMVAKSTLDLSLGEHTEWTVGASVAKFRRPEYWMRRPWENVVDPEYPPYIFPEPDLLLDLIDAYFICLNPLLPVLHRPTFEYSVRSGLHLVNDSFGGTVLAMCAVASLYSRDPRVLLEESGYSQQSAGFKYFKQLRLSRESFLMSPTLYDVQVHALAIFYLNSTSKCEKVWQLLATALRAAQDIALNRKQTKDGEPTIESELRKRVFFSLLMCEEIMAVYMGRSAMIKRYDFDVELPIDCDDEFWQNEEHPELAFKQPQGQPSKSSYFIQMIKLMSILADIQQAFYPAKKQPPPDGVSVDDWNEERLIVFDGVLEQWAKNLPDHLRWNPDAPHSVFFDQAATLHAQFHWVQILLHRPFISSKMKVGYLSLAVCRNAARATILVMDVQTRKGVIIPWVSVVMFLSGIILLVNLWRGKQMGIELDERREVQTIYKALYVLRRYEGCWHGAGRFCDILYSLLMISGFSEPHPLDDGTNGRQNCAPPVTTSWSPSRTADNYGSVAEVSTGYSAHEMGSASAVYETPALDVTATDHFTVDPQSHPHHAPMRNAYATSDLPPQTDYPSTPGIQNYDAMGFNQVNALAGVMIGFDWPEWGAYIANYDNQTQVHLSESIYGQSVPAELGALDSFRWS